MSRLTRLENGIYNPNKELLFIGEVMNKLGKLEDLEDELGCPLEVAFKALKEEKIYFNWYGKVESDTAVSLEKDCSGVLYISTYNDLYFCLKDYGKTWWLDSDRK